MLFAPLSLVAEILISRTHHRPLGAAVFATLAVVAWIFAEVTSRRSLDSGVCPVRARNRKIAWYTSGFFSLLVLGRGFL